MNGGLKGLFACREKSGFLGIDRVLFAVIKIDQHIGHRTAGQHALGAGFAYTFLHGRDKTTADILPHERFSKHDAAVARERFHAQPNLGEYAGAAGLFFVTMARFTGFLNGLAIGNPRFLQFHRHAIFILQSLGNDPQMQFALAGQDRLAALGVDAIHERRILLVQGG